MAVALDESKFFKFVIISDKPKPSKNNFTEKPPKDKELRDNNMSTSSSSPPPSNEKLDEKNQDNQNSQVANKLPEVKVDDSPNNNGDSTKEPEEQENEEKSSRLTIKVPSKSSSPQLVASPSELRAKTPEPVSPSQGSNFFKKLGNMIRSTSDNGTAPEQEEAATSDSKDQVQQEQQEQQVQQVQQEQQEQQEQPVANDNITENTVDTARSIDENKKEGEDKKNTPEPTPVKQRTNSLANLVNTKMFITRTSSLLKEVFDSIDRKMYPDMEPDWVAENQNKLNREAAISEREQLLENKDVEITNDKSQNPQSPQSTKNVMADVGVALNERKEKLENLGERTEELSNHAADFANLAKQLKERQEQKSKWFW